MPTMAWCELSLTVTDESAAEQANRTLFAEGAVAVERRGDQAVGTFLDELDAIEAARALGVRRKAIGTPDWAEDWLKQHAPFVISDRLVVAPRFVDAPPARVVLRIDPGLAFGTASHPTTFLCLKAIDALLTNKLAPLTMLDVGCGTGVLAIAALRLGVLRAVGTDIDPIALRTARRCARHNQISDDRFHIADVPPFARGGHPLVVANVPPPVLDELAPALSLAVQKNGRLFLSGFFADVADAVVKPFLREGLTRVAMGERQGWGLLELTK